MHRAEAEAARGSSAHMLTARNREPAEPPLGQVPDEHRVGHRGQALDGPVVVLDDQARRDPHRPTRGCRN